MAEEGKLDPVVGHEKERVSQILSRRKKTTLLIGEPGLENQQLLKV
jgi:ATP-dependent Clp protease ATP-binding subunit ClpA